jgi:hypothetical protein
VPAGVARAPPVSIGVRALSGSPAHEYDIMREALEGLCGVKPGHEPTDPARSCGRLGRHAESDARTPTPFKGPYSAAGSRGGQIAAYSSGSIEQHRLPPVPCGPQL